MVSSFLSKKQVRTTMKDTAINVSNTPYFAHHLFKKCGVILDFYAPKPIHLFHNRS